MTLYSWACSGCGAQRDVRLSMRSVTNGIRPACTTCGSIMQRLWTAPAIQNHRSAADVLNRAIAGEGDPMPGKTVEETRRSAEALAASYKQPQPRRPDVRKPSKPLTVYT